jgi:hypothetical protein
MPKRTQFDVRFSANKGKVDSNFGHLLAPINSRNSGKGCCQRCGVLFSPSL